MAGQYAGVILEEIQCQNTTIREMVGAILPLAQEIPGLKADMAEVKANIRTIKVVATGANQQVHNHERRITRLETAKA